MAKVYWMTGLSGSGKTSLAASTDLVVLDGDKVRENISQDLGYSLEDRREHTIRLARLARMSTWVGDDTIVATISPTEEMRELAKSIIGEKNFKLIYVSCPLEVCAERDVKGLYAEKYDQMTGVGSPYEVPKAPDYIIDTTVSFKESVKLINSIVCKEKGQ